MPPRNRWPYLCDILAASAGPSPPPTSSPASCVVDDYDLVLAAVERWTCSGSGEIWKTVAWLNQTASPVTGWRCTACRTALVRSRFGPSHSRPMPLLVHCCSTASRLFRRPPARGARVLPSNCGRPATCAGTNSARTSGWMRSWMRRVSPGSVAPRVTGGCTQGKKSSRGHTACYEFSLCRKISSPGGVLRRGVNVVANRLPRRGALGADAPAIRVRPGASARPYRRWPRA